MGCFKHFTEFHIHKAINDAGKPAKAVVVYKQNEAHCMYITEHDTLNVNLAFLDRDAFSGWDKDADVLEVLETYSIETHPEYFI
jgi:hypothetical protein